MCNYIMRVCLAISLLLCLVRLKTVNGETLSSPEKSQQVDKTCATIVADSKPTALIVLRKDHSLYEKQAATEIQLYVEKSTGAKLPITVDPNQIKGAVIKILVRKTDSLRSPEAFSVHIENNQIDIVGNSPLGALYGAYEFLERVIGVRWYLPDPLGEVVPKRTTIKLTNADIHQSPSFPMRWVGEGDWMLRNKQNHCNGGFRIAPGGYIYHTQDKLLPRKKYYQEHPEYFSLVDGKRSNKEATKLCYSNPEVAREIAKNMAIILQDDPNIDLISFSPSDWDMWCECPQCKAMDEKDVSRDREMSRRSLLFYNRLADELRKKCPQARILVGAYDQYNGTPKDKTIKADPMLNIIITHFQDYCMAHPISDENCPPNRNYVKLLDEWEQLVDKRIFIYEYYWKLNWFDLPWPVVHCIKKDIPSYRDRGYKGLFTQFSTQNCWTLFPNYYIAARLLWDADADVDAVVAKMYEDLFGEAAKYMKSYYGLMEKQMAECGKHFPGDAIYNNARDPRGGSNALAVFTPQVREQLRHYFERAVSVNKDETVARRLEKIGTSLEYIERLMNYAELREKARQEKDPNKALDTAKQALIVGETLVNEIRTNREKWNGIVAEETVRQNVFLGRSVSRWKTFISQIKD